jgi:hypothetical protein
MKKFITIVSLVAMSGCTTVNGVDTTQATNGKQLVTAVATIVVLGALAGQLGKENMKSKCANNRAGFWQDHTTGKIYTCP